MTDPKVNTRLAAAHARALAELLARPDAHSAPEVLRAARFHSEQLERHLDRVAETQVEIPEVEILRRPGAKLDLAAMLCGRVVLSDGHDVEPIVAVELGYVGVDPVVARSLPLAKYVTDACWTGVERVARRRGGSR